MLQQYYYEPDFELESGLVLQGIQIAFHTFGTLNQSKNNAIWICHALTANSDVADWWKGMVGSQLGIDTNNYFVVCANILGSCYGTTGPLNTNPQTQEPYYDTFPAITIRDMVKVHLLLQQYLGIDRIALLVGGSMGGYQALEWAIMAPNVIDKLFLLATSPAESAWGIAIHTAQRLALEADSTFGSKSIDAGKKGLIAARAIGMLTYRNYNLMVQQQSDTDVNKTNNFKASSYLIYQGNKLALRFDAYSYHLLTMAMDSHNIARNRFSDIPSALKSIKIPALLIGIKSDILCPPTEQQFLAQHLTNCTYHEIDSLYGHDGFLVEAEWIGNILKDWLLSTS